MNTGDWESLCTALDDDAYLVRLEAAEALGKLKDERSIDALLHCFNKRFLVKGMAFADALEAANSLIAMGKGELVEDQLIKSLAKYENSSWPESVAELLSKMKSTKALPALKAMAEWPSAALSDAARTAISEIAP